MKFANEDFWMFWNEARGSGLFEKHYDEINLNKAIKLDPADDLYFALYKMGMMEAHTMRDDKGVLVGYSVYYVQPHMHYKKSLTATNDILFVRKDCRRGLAGYKFLKYTVDEIKKRKPQRIFFHVKPHHDFGRLLERLGAKAFETMYSINLEV
ncbi:MAG: hypothetical protein KGJ90_05090, partial [Patescibacteria group bacterium]|nr:hypothetical protein [Patescibacteria group bacterium]